MPVARIEPERSLKQLWHRRHEALAGEIEIVGKPALGHEEAHELLRGLDVAAVLEHHGREEQAHDRESLAVRAKRPVDRRGVLEVVLRSLALESVWDRERLIRHHDDRLGQELLVVVATGVPVDRAGWRAALAIDPV